MSETTFWYCDEYIIAYQKFCVVPILYASAAKVFRLPTTLERPSGFRKDMHRLVIG
jgi:hypothetical protein